MQEHDFSGGYIIEKRPLVHSLFSKKGVFLEIYGLPLDFYWTYVGGAITYIETFFNERRYDNLKEINTQTARYFFRYLDVFVSYKTFERGESQSHRGSKLDIDFEIFKDKIVFTIFVFEKRGKPVEEKHTLTLYSSDE